MTPHEPYPESRNILQWRAARAMHEAKIRQGYTYAFDYAQKCCLRANDDAIAEIEKIIQFRLKEWEELNPKPKEE